MAAPINQDAKFQLPNPCWSCHQPVGGPACGGCGTVQPPPPKPDLFAVLGLPRKYHMDSSKVDDAHRQMSRSVHPDRFAGRKAVERRMSLQWTATVNEARRVLRSPLLRAHYLATGLVQPSEPGPTLDQGFLELMFDLRMALMEDPAEVHQQAEGLHQQLMDELGDIFAQWERGKGDLHEVEDRLARLRYVDGLRNAAST